MKVCVIGTGYVGLVTGVCLAFMGNEVVCVDNNEAKVRVLQSGQSPIHEPGLPQMLQTVLEKTRSSSLPILVGGLPMVKCYLLLWVLRLSLMDRRIYVT